jgi:hypothetical protein
MIKFNNLKFRFQLLTSITALLLVALLNSNILAQGLTGVKTIDPSGAGANNFLTLKFHLILMIFLM